MKKVDVGLYCIAIIGEKEEEAAEYYEKQLEKIERALMHPGTYYSDMIEALWRNTKKKFGVDIKVL